MSNRDLFETKVGYDSANKRMICRVYEHLQYVMESSDIKKSWVNVVHRMLTKDGKLGTVSTNGYYNSIKRNLKQIEVIAYNGRELVKGPNWDRFYSDEDWSWFITDTNSYGRAKIVK